MTTNRFVGGSAVLPINKFRDDEFLNEDNKYNKIVFENARKYILSQSNEDTMKPLNQITDQQKYVLTMLIQRFLNELDSSVKKTIAIGRTQRIAACKVVSRITRLNLYLSLEAQSKTSSILLFIGYRNE